MASTAVETVAKPVMTTTSAVGVELLGALQDLHAVHLLHPQVGEHQVEFLPLQFLEGPDAAVHRHGVVALLGEDVVQIFPGDEFVFDDQDPAAFHEAALAATASWGL